MGSEHSTQGGSQQVGHGQWNQRSNSASSTNRSKQIQRGKSVGEKSDSYSEENDESSGCRPGTISPGPSICSDSDLPYISYTVNRPIGDSPKLSNKQQLQRGRSLGAAIPSLSSLQSVGSGSNNKNRHSTGGILSGSKRSQQTQRPHSIVVVKSAADLEPKEKDPELLRLENVPKFLPIMQGTLNLPAARDPEVLERLDPNGTLNLCLRYQEHLSLCAETVSSEQNSIITKVREVDLETQRLTASLLDRQKKFTKFVEKIQKVRDLSVQLSKCHILLNQTLESVETLYNALPIDDRIEPFVWTTG